MIIQISGLPVTLKRKRVKNINLRIQHTGAVHVSAPLKMPLQIIYGFLEGKRLWIEKHHSKLKQSEQRILASGESIYFKGIAYKLQIHVHIKQRVELTERQIHIFAKPEVTQLDKRALLTKWYRTQMQQCLPPLLERWESVIDVTAHKVTIKQMRTRWGSCHPIKKHISLNLRLIEKPLICLEYVVVHELVHLLEASHNQRFYALMNYFLPNWQEIKKMLE